METPDQAPTEAAEEIVAPVEGEAAVEQVAEPVAEEPAVEQVEQVEQVAEVVAPAADAPTDVAEPLAGGGDEPVEEHVVDGLIDGDTLVPMAHPDGGGSDLYETNDKGEILVPATDVAVMVSHGFAVVEVAA